MSDVLMPGVPMGSLDSLVSELAGAKRDTALLWTRLDEATMQLVVARRERAEALAELELSQREADVVSARLATELRDSRNAHEATMRDLAECRAQNAAMSVTVSGLCEQARRSGKP